MNNWKKKSAIECESEIDTFIRKEPESQDARISSFNTDMVT